MVWFAAKGVLQLLILVLGTTVVASPPFDEDIPPRPKSGGIETRYCAFYNESNAPSCSSDDNSTCAPPIPEREECLPTESDKSNHCFVLWHYDNSTGDATVRFKGCFLDTVACNDRASSCRFHNAKLPLLHCCCEGDMCNENATFPGIEAGMPPSTEVPPERVPAGGPLPEDTRAIIAYTLTPLFLLFIVSIGCYFLYRRRKGSSFAELGSVEASLSRPPSTAGMDNEIASIGGQVTLCEIRARGRFGAVWRAKLGPRDVAVKVFPLQDKQSWLAEQEIYRLPRMDHPDILHYIGVDKKGDNLMAEYWLITAYHERGSLCDYLKANTLTWAQAWRISWCVARGLAHLHEEGGGKPAVAHRDFKSKNVLLKSDLTACIADFGLALVFAGRGCGDAHGQVGTRRYMAPEVLDGAINFTKDAFLRIDMYACALVLWEIVTRCEEGGPEPYRLPLEEEVGSHPGLEDMQDAVVLRKLRPHIPQSWREHPGLAVLSDTMEECWDHDAEARLSASCVLERVTAQRPMIPAKTTQNSENAPLLIEDLGERH